MNRPFAALWFALAFVACVGAIGAAVDSNGWSNEVTAGWAEAAGGFLSFAAVVFIAVWEADRVRRDQHQNRQERRDAAEALVAAFIASLNAAAAFTDGMQLWDKVITRAIRSEVRIHHAALAAFPVADLNDSVLIEKYLDVVGIAWMFIEFLDHFAAQSSEMPNGRPTAEMWSEVHDEALICAEICELRLGEISIRARHH